MLGRQADGIRLGLGAMVGQVVVSTHIVVSRLTSAIDAECGLFRYLSSTSDTQAIHQIATVFGWLCIASCMYTAREASKKRSVFHSVV